MCIVCSEEAVLTAENTDDSNHEIGDKLGQPLREQDRFLPIANVAKIMKKAIPESGKVYNINELYNTTLQIFIFIYSYTLYFL